MEIYEKTLEKLKKYGHTHLLSFWSTLNEEEKSRLISDIDEIDLAAVNKYFKVSGVTCLESPVKIDDSLEPLPQEVCGSVSGSDEQTLDNYREIGLRAIAAGEVCVLLLAGGQGTRLGVPYPKGMYDVGLPSGKTLYQIQAERISRIMALARRKYSGNGQIPWYVMTSEHTMSATQNFFNKHKSFGLDSDQIIFFEQHTLPAMDFDGKIILETPCKISKAPDGNGGLYRALREQGILNDMASRGVRYMHVYCVDNILVRVADPLFVGFCIHKNAECGNKVVEKRVPTEAVGVFGLVDGKYQIVEYSEISKSVSEKRTPNGERLLFSAGNIANHFFTLDFVRRICEHHEMELKHHVARKKVPTITADGKPLIPMSVNGIKMEKFVFDVSCFAKNFVVWGVEREDEFAPLKNAQGTGRDCPETCREALLSYHGRLLAKSHVGASNGNNVTNGESKFEVEISPLVSYDGEDLMAATEGLDLHVKSPSYIERTASGAVVMR